MHIAEKYALDILDGKRLACKWVKLACKRHLDDLKAAKKKGAKYYFDAKAADHAIGFIETFRHYKGDFAGQRFRMLDWQKFIVGNIFGWKKVSNNKRRYKYAFIEVPRKNGKTFLGGGVGNYLLSADGEGGAEIYCAATKKDQAKILWKDIKTLIERSRSPRFIERFKIRQKPEEIEFPQRQSFCVPLGRDKDGGTLDGLNPHGLLLDEIHAWKSFDYWNVLNSAMGARSQPLMLMITTAGYVMNGVGKEQEKIAMNILEGRAKGDDYFAVIHTIDKDDDIRDPKTWEKANPCYGVTVTEEKCRSYLNLAEQNPDLMREFLVKWLNKWVYQVDSWLEMSDWKANFADIDLEELKGLRCYGGLDIAQVNDLSALVLLFPPQDGLEQWTLLCRFWCPAENIVEKANKTGVPYHTWAESGEIIATPGNVTDYRYIERELIELANTYDIRACAFDRTFSGAMIQNIADELGDDFMVEFSQSFMRISSPAKEFQRMVIGQEINHLNNPVLDWMAGNAVVALDPNGNIKPDKGKSEGKIDGIVSAIMALGIATELEGDHGDDFSAGLMVW